MTIDRKQPNILTPASARNAQVAAVHRSENASYDPTIAQMLAEMDSALADEIAVSEQHHQRQRIATNGQVIGAFGTQYLYSFSLDEPWEPEDETPLTIRLQGSQSIQASVVTASGTSLTISAEALIPSESLAKIYLTDDPTQLLHKLRDVLKVDSLQHSPVSAKAFGVLPLKEQDVIPVGSYPNFVPRPSQAEAIQFALSSEVAYIIGPPGTGKTSSLAAIAFSHVQNGLSVLIAAHTNIAVDNAITKLADMCKTANVPALRSGQIIRHGTPQLQSVRQRDDIYTPNILKHLGRDLERERTALSARHARATERLQVLTQQHQTLSTEWAERQSVLLQELQMYTATLSALQRGERERVETIDRNVERVDSTAWSLQVQMQSAQSTLSQLVARNAYLDTIHSQRTAAANDMTSRLMSAQQMNSVLRLLKGINIDRLTARIAALRQQLWEIEQERRTVSQQSESAHATIAELQLQLQHLAQERDGLLKRRPISPEVRQRIQTCEIDTARLNGLIISGKDAFEREIKTLLDEEKLLRADSEALSQQLASIDVQLHSREKSLLDQAQVVATTLTKVYMDSRLSNRRFDVVIVDEASMAPLPMLYVAAGHAHRSLLAIGDPQQLAPIVKADTPVAKKWLGRSIFDVAEVNIAGATSGDGQSRLLREQSRMHPQISAVARKYVYQGLIADVHVTASEAYNTVLPVPASRLVLCDTGDGAPVTSRPGGSSRINLYHALCSVAVARQILQTLPPPSGDRDHPYRVGIVTPYRKQAELIQRLVKGEGLDREVRIGTVHRFQGLEYEAVVFDTVESPPYRHRRDFLGGGPGSQGQRLTNVAVTRAQHKLVIIANAQYILSQFGANDTLSFAVREAQHAGNIPSRDLLKAIDFPVNEPAAYIHGRKGSAGLAPDSIEWLSDAEFFDRFIIDVRSATSSVTIISPFVRQARTAKLLPELQKKSVEGISITVVASSSEQGNPTVDKEARESLERAGIDFRTSPGMHEKAVIIDASIAYFGSLNPLSHNATTEVMQRVTSPWYAGQLADAVRINERTVPAVWGEEFSVAVRELPHGETCPACGGTLQPRVGKYGVFYGCGRYPECQHTQEISERQLFQVPTLAQVRCAKCGAEPMRPRVQRKDVWLECVSGSCDFRRKVVFAR